MCLELWIDHSLTTSFKELGFYVYSTIPGIGLYFLGSCHKLPNDTNVGLFLSLLPEQSIMGTNFQNSGGVCQTVVLTKHRQDAIFGLIPTYYETKHSFISSLILPFPRPYNKYSCRTRVSYLTSTFWVFNWPKIWRIWWDKNLLVSLGPPWPIQFSFM